MTDLKKEVSAELETPRTDAADMISYECQCYVDVQFARRLERELAEANKDAARYRWLRSDAWDSDESPWCVTWVNPHDLNKGIHSIGEDELDEAIDEAMK